MRKILFVLALVSSTPASADSISDLRISEDIGYCRGIIQVTEKYGDAGAAAAQKVIHGLGLSREREVEIWTMCVGYIHGREDGAKAAQDDKRNTW